MHRMKSAIAAIPGMNSLTRGIRPDTSGVTNLSAEQILAGLPSHISSLDCANTWNTISPGNCEYFSNIRATDFNHWVATVVHVQDRVGILKAVDDCRANNKEVIAEFRVLDKLGTCKVPDWIEFKCASLADGEYILTILRDISGRKSLEQQARKSRDLADKSNAAKSRFLANMSHELRTPLNAIIGFSDLLKSGMVGLNDTEKQVEYQGLINDSAHHLLHVLNDILDMSKIEAGKYEIHPEEVDFAKIIQSSCAMLMPLAQNANVMLDLSRVNQSIMMEADSKAIRQIIINIVSNAIKFTRPNTVIEISAQRLGREVEFIVKDYGRGISPEGLKSLGNPFYQVDNEKSRKHEGTGLGLSIVKGLLELHGGTFSIKSGIDIGTTVTIALSRSHGANTPVPADDADTIIRIRPQNSGNRLNSGAISRLAG